MTGVQTCALPIFSQRNRVVAANTLRPDSNQVGTTVSQAALADEAKRIAAAFDPDSPEQTLDRFGRRWLKCVECGQIKDVRYFRLFYIEERG